MRFAAAFAPFAMISLLCACPASKPADGPKPATPSADVAEFAALAWVPDRPTYLMTAHTVAEAQRSFVDVIDSFGIMAASDANDVGSDLERVLTVDPLSDAGAQKLGVDPNGSIAMYSEGLDPTIVVHLSALATTQAFFDAVKARARTVAAVIDGVEVVTATIDRQITVSWAIDKDWLWVHFAFGLDKDPNADWFVHGHHRGGTGEWVKNFGVAKQLRAAANKGLLGYFDAHALLGVVRTFVSPLAKCFDRFTPVSVVGFAIEGDGHHAGGKLALDLGPAAKGVAASILPPPAGFAAIAQTAPIALQWNLDIGAVASFLSPCLAVGGGNTNFLTKFGVRSGRVALQTFTPNDTSGTGVVSADLADKSYLAGLLDQIPHRSMLESNHTFGGFAGHRISVPFLITVDYVLDDAHGMAAVGEGLMDKLVAPGATTTAPPLFGLDLIVSGLSAEAWQFLLAEPFGKSFARRAVEHLQQWHDGHIRVSIDHDSLVVEASGNRR